ncbi:MAG: hypothetical protein NC120_09405 [Ruminococcus sp.]|nr:hypothetical protein [Ruminococcus sp.]
MIKETQEKFAKRAAKGMLWWLAGEFICIIFNMCMLIFMTKFMAVKIFTAISSAIIANGLFFNFAYNTAVRDRNLIKYHDVGYDKKMSVKIALTAPLPQYVMWIMLLLSKLGVIGDIFRYYIWANIQTIAWIDLFTSGRDIASLSWSGLFGLLLLMLIAPAVIIITYECVIRDIDVKALVLYGKKK